MSQSVNENKKRIKTFKSNLNNFNGIVYNLKNVTFLSKISTEQYK